MSRWREEGRGKEEEEEEEEEGGWEEWGVEKEREGGREGGMAVRKTETMSEGFARNFFAFWEEQSHHANRPN